METAEGQEMQQSTNNEGLQELEGRQMGSQRVELDAVGNMRHELETEEHPLEMKIGELKI